jgi:IclR family acetate operon transcriptional repressor
MTPEEKEPRAEMFDQVEHKSSGPARSVERALDILRVLRESRVPLRLSDIARESGNHLATTQRILNVLVRSGYANQHLNGYTIGITSLLNGYSFLLTNNLVQVSLPVLQELSHTSGFFASLAVRFEMHAVLLVRLEGISPLGYQLPVGEPMPLHLGGARVLAAYMEPAEVKELLNTLPEIRLGTGETMTPEEFIENLRVIREQGYVVGRSQRMLGGASAAVPVHDRDGKVVASLQLSGTDVEMTAAKMDWCVGELKRASVAIEKRLS